MHGIRIILFFILNANFKIFTSFASYTFILYMLK
jgi:hypothetical protein